MEKKKKSSVEDESQIGEEVRRKKTEIKKGRRRRRKRLEEAPLNIYERQIDSPFCFCLLNNDGALFAYVPARRGKTEAVTT